MKEGDKKEDLLLDQEDLLQQISVYVKVISSDAYLKDSRKLTQGPMDDLACFKVQLNDKIDKIVGMYALQEKSGFLVYDGKVIQTPQEVTFLKKLIPHKARIALVSHSSSKCQQWVRFPEFYYTDYYYMNTRYYDAVVFIPKRTVYFFGFGIFANYNKANMELKVKWVIDSVESEEHEVNFDDDEKDPEKKWFEVNIT
mmetsp:Transcript_18089/g.30880  ORF Transcript_18089/g.30880 Transcript_18089/m.30880 type:complete len:198 (+) Transcript_18089:464-1057(+)